MKISTDIFSNLDVAYDISKLTDLRSALFVDIETTGLSPKNSFIYMIGMAYYEGGAWCFKGLFAENAADEETILKEFKAFSSSYTTLIHFNGNRFDLPFIKERLAANGIESHLDGFDGIDIYKRITPYKHILGISNCKQKTIEEYLGIDRIDEYSGGELINVYKEYMENKNLDLYDLLFQHNHDDLLGMLMILPMLSYADIFISDVHVDKVTANTYKDHIGGLSRELMIDFSLGFSVPHQVSFNANDCYVSIKGSKGLLKIPIYHEELKYFYENYKEYYYLPMEDMAIHKSVAIYVDKEFREQAKASNCYTRVISDFLPQWDYLMSPFFKREYDSKHLYFELTEELKSNRAFFSKYTEHLLQMMLQYK